MKLRIILLLGLCTLTTLSVAQTGRSISWDTDTSCGVGPTKTSLCVLEAATAQYPAGSVLVSVKGSPLAPPPNSGTFSITLGATLTGAPGTAASVTNVGTPQVPQLVFQIPAGIDGKNGSPGPMGPAGPPSSFTSLHCNSITGTVSMSGGIITLTNADAVGCTAK